MKKRILLLAALILALSCVGCGSKAEIEALRKENRELRHQLNELSSEKKSTQPTQSPVNTSTSTDSQENTVKFNYINTEPFNNCLFDGMYRCGTDFDAGDYYILSLYSANANYNVTDNPNTSSWSNHRIIKSVHIDNGQYIKLDNALLIPQSAFDSSDWRKYGAFKVGEDLPPGDYKMQAISDEYRNAQLGLCIGGNLAAYQITAGDPLSEAIDCSSLFDKQTYITLKDGQTIMINNATLTKVQ